MDSAQPCPNRGFDTRSVQATFGEQLVGFAVFNEDIGQAQVEQRYRYAFGGKQFVDSATGTASHHVLFQGHQQVVVGSGGENRFAVQRLHRTHIEMGGVECFRHVNSGAIEAAKGKQGYTLAWLGSAFTTQLGLADFQRFEVSRNFYAWAAATRIAHRSGARVVVCGAEHGATLRLVGRRQNHHAGNTAQKGEVHAAVMGRAILTYQAGAVDGEGDIEILHRHVMNQLVIAALQEGGIDRHYRLHAFTRHAGTQRYRVLLSDGHIEIALGILLREADQVGAFTHRRGNADQSLIHRRHVT